MLHSELSSDNTVPYTSIAVHKRALLATLELLLDLAEEALSLIGLV